MPNSPSHSNGIKKNKWTAFWDSALDWISFIAGGPIHYLWQKDPWLQVAPHIHISYATFPIHSNHVMANVRFSIGVISPRLLLNVYGGVLKWVYPKASSISDRDFQWNKHSMGDPPFMETPIWMYRWRPYAGDRPSPLAPQGFAPWKPTADWNHLAPLGFSWAATIYVRLCLYYMYIYIHMCVCLYNIVMIIIYI